MTKHSRDIRNIFAARPLSRHRRRFHCRHARPARPSRCSRRRICARYRDHARSDHSINVPARYVYTERRIRVEHRHRHADRSRPQPGDNDDSARADVLEPVALKKPAADGRRWVGVEAAKRRSHQDRLLRDARCKYRVRGTMFEDQIPFGRRLDNRGEYVVKVDGTGGSTALLADQS